MLAWNLGALALLAANTLILGYFLLLQGSYLFLLLIATVSVLRYRRTVAHEHWRSMLQSSLTLPISLIAPAYNEERTIIASVHSLLSLEYPEYEVIVVNDGSRDATLHTLVEHFALQPNTCQYRVFHPLPAHSQCLSLGKISAPRRAGQGEWR